MIYGDPHAEDPYKPIKQSGSNYYCTFELGPSARYLSASTFEILLFPFEYFFPSMLPSFKEQSVTPLIGRISTQSELGVPASVLFLQKKIDELKELAGIQRKLYYQTTPNGGFSSTGGVFSLCAPVLTLPLNQLRRTLLAKVKLDNGEATPSESEKKKSAEWKEIRIPFGDNSKNDEFTVNPHFFTDNEIRFLILREMGKIKEKKQFLRTVSKIVAVALFVGLGLTGLAFMGPLVFLPALPLLIKLGLWIGYTLFHNCIVSRYLEKKADDFAVRTLAKHFENKLAAKETFSILHNPYSESPTHSARFVAIKTLEKMAWLNRLKKNENCFNQWCITKVGSDWRDLSTPSLTTRINRIRSKNYHV